MDVDEIPTLPTALALHQITPNPFNPMATIRYEMPEPGEVKLTIYNASGRLVRTLRDGAYEDPGRREVVWRGKDDAGRLVPSGVYFCRLEVGPDARVRKMLLLK